MLVLRSGCGRCEPSALRTPELGTGHEKHVVDAGPCSAVRHRGYAGSLLTWTGFALAWRSLLVTALVLVLLGRAYQRRTTTEKAFLRRDLPGFADYARRTSKLVPCVW